MKANVLYLHGWGLHGGVWDAVRAVVPGEAPDLPGYGVTPSMRPYTAEGLADALAKMLTAPSVVVGWSMGGMVALALAARHPHKVSRLVLVGSTPCFVARDDWPHGMSALTLAAFAADLQRDYRATLQRFLALQARGGDAAREVVVQLRAGLRARAEPSPETLAAGLELLRGVDLRAAIAGVSCPTLLLHGAYDTLCPAAAAEWLAVRLHDASLALHAQASHAPFLSHPAWFNAALRDFVEATA